MTGRAARGWNLPVQSSPEGSAIMPDRGLSALIRRSALRIGTVSLSPLVFRLSVGRWPNRGENMRFASAMSQPDMQVPAILRALIATPAAWPQLSNMISFYLMAKGSLARTEEGGIAPRSGNPLAFWQGEPVTFLHFERRHHPGNLADRAISSAADCNSTSDVRCAQWQRHTATYRRP
jgi:hypothetical protein